MPAPEFRTPGSPNIRRLWNKHDFNKMEKWVQDQLYELLKNRIPDEVVRWIVNTKAEDLDEILMGMLAYDNPKHVQFVKELKRRQAQSCDAPSSSDKRFNSGNEKSSQSSKNENARKKGKSREKETISAQENSKPSGERVDKKKTKFVNLYSQEGKDRQTILLKGRCKCDCEARTHALINNCLNCGRIVCQQEGAGPCLFCDAIVCTPDQQILLSSNTKQGDQLYNRLKEQKPAKKSEEAVIHRDKLLEYDRNSSRRTEVIDDESDYYQSSNSVWLSTAEREKLQKREEDMRNAKYQSRLTRKVTLDFMGREVVEEPENDIYDVINAELRESADSMIARVSNDANVCPSIDFQRPWYVEMNNLNVKNKAESKIDDRLSFHNRIQDKEYLEMADDGVCLSLHQPYASFLVAGIKTHEGRGWYSSHRGRLWIAAASKVPDTETISMLENRYRHLLNDNIQLPENYPTGCLLGCVTVSDVLPNADYRRLYPQGDSDSPYIFICQDCHELPLKFPMQGKHKIFKLEKKIHQAAMKSLEMSQKIRGP